MDRGSEFKCEFRARRIRVRGNYFAYKSLFEKSERCVHLIDLYLIGLHLINLHLIGLHFIGRHLIGRHLKAWISWACIS